MTRLAFACTRCLWVLLLLAIASGIVVQAQEPPAETAKPESAKPAGQHKTAAQGLGQLVIVDRQSGTWQRLCVARYHTNVVLSAPVALVQIDQTFYNPYDGQEEGTFVLNLPPGASVCRFAVYLSPTELVEGELVDRSKLVDSDEYLVRRQQVPAILQEIGDNLFRMRVSPVPGRDVKRILLDYTVPLEPEPDDTCQFSLPLLSDLEPVWDFRIRGRILGPVPPESVVCPSHPELVIGDRAAVDASADNEAANPFGGPGIPFELVRQAYEPREPFTLRFRHAPNGPATMQVCQVEPPPAEQPYDTQGPTPDSLVPMTYFRIELQGLVVEKHATVPLDLLILADTSALMRGRAEVAEIVGRVIDHLRPEDRVRLVCVDVAARPMHEGWLSPDSAELTDARSRFGNEFCLGGIDLVGSLHEAVASLPPVEAGRRRLAVYVGSGGDTLAPSTEPELVQALTRLLNEARLPLLAMHVSGLSAVAAKQSLLLSSAPLRGRSILEAAARATGGLIWVSADRVEQRAFERWLDRGMPTPVRIDRIRVAGAKPDDLFFPTAWLPGESLTILGRVATSLTKDRVELDVTTQDGGEPVERRYPLTVAGQDNNMLIGRLWAQQKLRRLAPLAATNPWEHTASVVDVCREWSVLSPQMIFVLIDSDGAFARWGFDPLRRRYWKDDGVAQLAPLPQAWRDRLLAARQSIAAQPQAGPNGLEVPSGPAMDIRGSEADGLGWQRLLFRPTGEMRRLGQPSPSLLWNALLEPDEEYERLFPHYRAMLTPMDIGTPSLKLHDLASLLSERTGMRVEVDGKALEDIGVSDDFEVGAKGLVLGRGRISLYSYVRHVLRRFALTMVMEPDALVITIPEEAEERLHTALYPVADFILPTPPASRGLLADPVFDAQQAAEERVQRHLQRPVSLDARETPLEDVLSDVAEQLDIPLVIDPRDFDDRGLDRKLPVSIQCQDMAGRDALEKLLRPLHLGTMFDDGALLVGDWHDAAWHRQTIRFYSVQGVVYEHKVLPSLYESVPDRSPQTMRLAEEFLGGKDPKLLARRIAVSAGGEMPWGTVPYRETEDGMERTGDGNEEGNRAAVTSARFGHADNLRWSEGRVTDQPRYEADFDAIVETITGTVAPQTWDHVGGPGSIVACPFTLDLVVDQVGRVHDEIEELLRQLRQLPSAVEGHPAMRPARVPRAEYVTREDMQRVMDLLKSLVSPQTWSEVGGPGEIAVDLPHGALLVSQPRSVQQRLRHFITQLRRRRYEQLWPDRPWEMDGGVTRPRIDPWGIGPAMNRLQPANLPTPEPAELSALQWRQLPERGRWVWRRTNAKGEPIETVTLVQDGARLEVLLPECVIRLEGEEAALAWPELGLVELGPWGEAIRHVLDQRLPWLPHRTNENLARWYDVLPAAADINTAGGEKVARLVPPGFTPLSGTYMVRERADADHLPGQVTSFVDAKMTGRLRWAKDAPAGPALVWEDAVGKVLARWELLEQAVEPAEVPPLGEPRAGFVLLDRRGDESANDLALAEAIAAFDSHNWPKAVAKLAEAADRNPGHPLLVLLRAWCHGQAPDLEPPDRRLVELEEAIAAGHALVFRWVGEGHPAWMNREQRYQVLRKYSPKLQTWDDMRLVVTAATRAAQYEDAIKLIDAAMRSPAGADDRTTCFDQQQVRVDLLLKCDWFLEAEAAASSWADRGDATPGELAILAAILSTSGRSEMAADFLTRAAVAEATAEEKARLLRRLANLEEGMPRWQRLLEAMELLPDDSPRRAQWAETLISEMRGPVHAEIPARLAEKTRDETLRARLRMIHADRLLDLTAAGNVFWQLAEEGHLPAERMPWAMSLWNRKKQPERTIATWERELQRDKTLHAELLPLLRDAYLAAGRPADARRAATEP